MAYQLTDSEVIELQIKAFENRKRIVEMVYQAGVGHVGGSLSIIDILTAIFELEVDYSEADRTRVVMSKGHVTPALYAVMTAKGIVSEDEYSGFRRINSRLQGHPCRADIPEIDASTGLLGQGLSIAFGYALAKRQKGSTRRVYGIAGDGEIQEGQIWEAMMAAAHYKLDNLCFVIDYNKLSSSGPTNGTMGLEPLADKICAFGHNVIEIDGHDFKDILKALDAAKSCKEKPTTIIANTHKGNGVSFMQDNPAWHSKGLSDEEYKIATLELDLQIRDLQLDRQ